MTSIPRKFRLFFLVPLIASSLAGCSAIFGPKSVNDRQIATEEQVDTQSVVSSQQAETPWLYRGSDIPPHPEWVFGEMENGLRYAVRQSSVPPRQAAIRVRIDAGSLHEREYEQGYAHLLEHLLFRESPHIPQGQAIATWQRLGATFGSDANAETSPTHTAYKLDIPNIDTAKLSESLKILSGMVREPVLSEENVRAEVPIVLAEKRERGGAAERVTTVSRQTLFAGQRLAERQPIGTVETLQGATGERLQEFHRRWYRPENTVIVIVGDAPTDVLAGLVEQHFGSWSVEGEGAVPPDFGDPVAPEGVDPDSDWPVGEIAVSVESDLPRAFTFGIMRPWRQVDDTIVYNEGEILKGIAQAVINRRLESRARSGGSFLYAAVQQDDISRSTDATFVSFAPLDEDWERSLRDVRAVIADAIATPPTQEEIDREVAEYDIIFVNQLEQQSVISASQQADNLVDAVDIRETIADPQTVLDVFRGMNARFNPEEVLAATRELFKGDVVRATYITPALGEADEATLRLALNAEAVADGSSRLAAQTVSFEDQPVIGEPGDILNQGPIGLFQDVNEDIEQVNFANGTRALLWSNDNEPGRVTVKVRFGAGYRAFDESNAVYASLGEDALVSSGLGDLGQEELDRLATGRKLGFDFSIDDAVFTFEAQTRSEDVADQLYLFAAKIGMPRWDPEPLKRAVAAGKITYQSYATSPGGILNRDLEYLVSDRDPRFAIPTPEQLEQVTPERFREVWEPLLKQGPVEVLVFGQFDRDAIVQKLAETFGALPERDPIPAEIEARVPVFPAVSETPTIVQHRGDTDQAAAVVVWPIGGGIERLRESRKLEILSRIFSNRLLDALREKAGASYAPQVFANWPSDLEGGGGTITALAQIEPENVPTFFAEAERIANDLTVNPVDLDELTRVTEPLGQLINRASTGNIFWLYQLEGASFDPRRIALIPSLFTDFARSSPEEMQLIASRYLGTRPGYEIAILPEGVSYTDLPAPIASDEAAETVTEVVTEPELEAVGR